MISIFYVGNYYLDHFRDDLNDIDAHHFNNIVFPVTDYDLIYRKENLIEMGHAAREAGFLTTIAPASIGNLFGYGNPSILLYDAETRMKSPDGKLQERVCPRLSRRFEEIMYDLMHLAEKMSANWFLFDEPDLSSCYCTRCCGDVPMLSFLQHFISALSDINISTSVCFWAGRIHPETYSIAEIVDDVGFSFPPEYFTDTKHFQIWANYARVLAEKFNITSSVWHQGYNIEAGMEEYLIDQVALAEEIGIDNQGAWIFRGGEGVGYARCENPEKMWEVAEVAFRQLI